MQSESDDGKYKEQREVIKKAVSEAGGSISDLSDITGISARHIHDLLSGNKKYSKPSEIMFKMIASGEKIDIRVQYIKDLDKQVATINKALKKIKPKRIFCEKIGISYEYLRRLSKGKCSWSFQVQIAIINLSEFLK